MILAAVLATSMLRQGTVEVPFRLGESAIIVDATLNGRTLSFMFDTGFGGAFVVDRKVNLGKASGAMTLRDFVGEFQAETVKLNSVKLGSKDVDATDMEAVMQPADYSFSYNTHCDGIMGFSTIKGSVTEINFQNKKFIFHPATVDISKRIPDNKKTFLLKMLPIGHSAVQLEVAGPTGKKMVLTLDTGNAFFATTHRDVLERTGLWPADRKPAFVHSSFVASGPVDSWSKKLDNMTIFGVPVPSSYWDIIDLPSGSAESDGTVGFGFLKNFNIIIDYDRRRVWLENWTGDVANKPEGNPGISAAFDERQGRVRVYKVTPGSPAEAAGVLAGDSILSINGNEVAGSMGPREIGALIEGEVGSKVTVVLSRQGQVIRLELERKALVND